MLHNVWTDTNTTVISIKCKPINTFFFSIKSGNKKRHSLNVSGAFSGTWHRPTTGTSI